MSIIFEEVLKFAEASLKGTLEQDNDRHFYRKEQKI